jgi:C1A family cysteine protease
MNEMHEVIGMGWLPDYPDYRDYTMDKESVPLRLQALKQRPINTMLSEVGVAKSPSSSTPDQIDVKKWCSPVENQLNLGSCTANAGVGLIEYFENRAFGRHVDASRMFLYKVTRNLLGWTGDTGAFLRTTMAAMALFGVPPKRYWPYIVPDFDNEPTAFCYAFAQSYQAITYYRLDPRGTPRDTLLNRVKLYLRAGLPSMFGFTVYSSYTQARTTGKIPFPASGESRVGGHAVVAVGYDDKMKIKSASPGAKETTGALMIRNSWGQGWGDNGYGWLPYKYVLRYQAIDWWSLLKSEWIDTGKFGL